MNKLENSISQSLASPRNGPSPDEVPGAIETCAKCAHMVWEGPMIALNPWHAMHCGRVRETKPPYRPAQACWWARYGNAPHVDGLNSVPIGECGPAARYFEQKK